MDGVIPDLTFALPFVFHVDLRDGTSSFTIRQIPTVAPVREPATALPLIREVSGMTNLVRRRVR